MSSIKTSLSAIQGSHSHDVLLWTFIVGATYHNLVGFSALLVLSNPTPNVILSEYEPLPYVILVLVMIICSIL